MRPIDDLSLLLSPNELRRSLLVCHDNFCHFLLKFNLRYIFIAVHDVTQWLYISTS